MVISKEVPCKGVGVVGIHILAVYHEFAIFFFGKLLKEVDDNSRKSVAVHDHNLANSAALTGSCL